MLDVATGSADIPLALYRWARHTDVDLDIVALDMSPAVLHEAHRVLSASSVRVVRGDARALPYLDSTFDVVSCCLALHHFDPADAIRVLEEMWRVSSGAAVVTDLRRAYIAYAAAWLATRTIAPGVLTRHDGPLSVLRAYTPAELRELARSAGWDRITVRQTPFFRQVLVGTKFGSPVHG